MRFQLVVLPKNNQSILGCLLSGAVGDALGLPYENLSPRRLIKLLGPPDRYRYFFGYGMVSDDTEHACIVAQSLCLSPTDPKLFAKQLKRRLVWWFLSLPAGIGMATARACIKLLCGYSPERSGVYSAGNGPAMRSAILGVTIDDVAQLKEFVRASTIITHTDPKAYEGALAIALAAWCASREMDTPEKFFDFYFAEAGEISDAWRSLLQQIQTSLASGQTTTDYAAELCGKKGVSGYIYRTVPVVLHAWLRHPNDFRQAMLTIIQCGGDADSTAAILGGIVGSRVGLAGIPREWIDGLLEYPRPVSWMKQLAQQLEVASTTKELTKPVESSWFISLIRNLFFLMVVLVHAVRRLLPPY
jgi:ADP-ribosyl-[dinitrogen reductase] hydrolase